MGGHNVLWFIALSGGFVGRNVGPGASLLMIVSACIACCTHMPGRHIITAQVAVVVVVNHLLGLGGLLQL